MLGITSITVYKKIKKKLVKELTGYCFLEIAHGLISALTQISAHPLGYSIKQVSSPLPFTILNSRDKRQMQQSVHHNDEDDEIIYHNYFISMHNDTPVC